MAALSQEARDKGIVAASAGNHAQGVALAARVLNCHATIFHAALHAGSEADGSAPPRR